MKIGGLGSESILWSLKFLGDLQVESSTGMRGPDPAVLDTEAAATCTRGDRLL
jgi:hypothetical protein